MSKIVSYARTQTRVYVRGAGDLGDVFPPEGKTLEGLHMQAEDVGLVISFLFRAEKYELLIPYANLIAMRLSPPTAESKSLKVVKSHV